MEPLKSSFETVADWCERHFELGRGSRLADALRIYGMLATLPSALSKEEYEIVSRQLRNAAERLLSEFARPTLTVFTKYTHDPVIRPTTITPGPLTTYTYDAGARCSRLH
jgi:hypothetical protein